MTVEQLRAWLDMMPDDMEIRISSTYFDAEAIEKVQTVETGNGYYFEVVAAI